MSEVVIGETNTVDERKARAKAKRQENAAKMNAAKTTVREFTAVAAFKKLPEHVQDAINFIVEQKRVAGPRGPSAVSVFAELFDGVGSTVSMIDLFIKTKKGVAETKRVIRDALKKAAPEDRMWIQYDDENESWVLLGVGADVPEGWSGPVDF